MISRFKVGDVLLSPLIIQAVSILGGSSEGADVRVELGLPGEEERFRFVIECKSKSTPQSVQLAVAQAKAAAHAGEWPMIQVPYLSPERLDELERAQVSGVDLCGNGVVVVPGRLCVARSGQPNQYRDSRPLSNPYRGRSAMVARILLKQRQFASLKDLVSAIQTAGVKLSLPQASKAVQALEDELMVSKSAVGITARETLRLLDKLGSEWRKPWTRGRQALRLPPGTDVAHALSASDLLKWAVTGESSVSRYVTFSQSGPPRIAVSSLPLALTLVQGKPESVPNFADVIFIETDEPGFFFDNETDENRIRWASRLQTWLELQSGDARQQDAARDLRDQILKKVQS